MNRETRLTLFWQQLQAASQRVLLLDYDGTLAPFRAERDQAFPYPGVRELIDQILVQGDTRLIIITGRATGDLLPLLGLDRPPEIWGCHGWEHLLPGCEPELGKLPPKALRSLKEARQWALDQGYRNHCESKPASVALHWRGLPPAQVDSLRLKTRLAWEGLAKAGELELHPFDGGLELRCPGRDKGSAVRQVLAETETGAVIAYLGDDLTDEDAFLALKDRGLSVLVRSEPRPTTAELWLKPPEELLAFLQDWLDRTRNQ